MNKNSKGFTLIELMVVVLIIAILIAIAVPSFTSAKRRAECKRGVQSACEKVVKESDRDVTSFCDEHGNRVYVKKNYGKADSIAIAKDDC